MAAPVAALGAAKSGADAVKSIMEDSGHIGFKRTIVHHIKTKDTMDTFGVDIRGWEAFLFILGIMAIEFLWNSSWVKDGASLEGTFLESMAAGALGPALATASVVGTVVNVAATKSVLGKPSSPAQAAAEQAFIKQQFPNSFLAGE